MMTFKSRLEHFEDTVGEYVPEWLQFTILPHILLSVLLIAAVVPQHQHQAAARIAFHGLYGVLLILAPSALLAAKVTRSLDRVHLFLDRFLGAFQIGFAYYAYQTQHSRNRPEPPIALAKTITAGLIAAHEFFAYYSVSTNERGVFLAGPWFLFAFVLDLSYFLVEAYDFLQLARRATNPDEVDVLVQLTKRYVDGRTSIRLQYLFWADAIVALLYAVTSIPSADYIYKNVIEHNIQLDYLHRLLTAEFGYYALGTGVMSLLATQFSVYHQRTYVEQRIITQLIIAALHVFGSWSVYPFAQFFPHYIALVSFVPLYFIHDQIEKIGLLPEDLPEKNGVYSVTRLRTKYTKTT